MPIYAYRCVDCGFAKDVLQKLSDAPLTECPTCGTQGFRKQLTAAGIGTSIGGSPSGFSSSSCFTCPVSRGGSPCG